MLHDTDYMNIRAYIKSCIRILNEIEEENEKEKEQTTKNYGEIIKTRALRESKEI